MKPLLVLSWVTGIVVLSLAGCQTPKTPSPGPGNPPSNPNPNPTPPSGAKRVVIDAGHGGTSTVGGSSANNATSYSGVLEKKMTLEMAQMVRNSLNQLAPDVDVIMTRNSDINVGLAARANKAIGAECLVSIHMNAFNGVARGLETHVRPSSSNLNLSADKGLANRIQNRAFAALKSHDSEAIDRGVKETSLAILSDSSLGNTSGNAKTRAVLVEVEFIDVQKVDRLLNIAPNPEQVKRDIAHAIARGIIDDINAN